ncbi:nucleoside triphosphate pyrophosphohydrolase [Halieaceae bacterium IMCC14734]|uniref:Nucleoside triphosphate pyrophosphohydrolase n=2 Tax=Candidatus Litorirhabdus singularis TaxID=2518993 RepID=A0ABT3THM2_9GAMM|nr:nucleoside triphosphate pyrophosphohydrolase [Candidatus Litorirhabdus singularis]
MERLRDPEYGCPWDLQQDFRSIVDSTLEESYELVSAIEAADYDHVREELGDVLFQVVFYAQLGREQNLFDFPGIVNTLVEKLLRRHPHVFADGAIEGLVAATTAVDEVATTWETIKRKERRARAQTGVLDDVPVNLPALSRAQKISKRAAQVGFDWLDTDGVMAKVEEELAEFAAARHESAERAEEELGDLIFTCVNLARHAGADAETALRRATLKFERRFTAMEAVLKAQGMTIAEASAAEREAAWESIKAAPEAPR